MKRSSRHHQSAAASWSLREPTKVESNGFRVAIIGAGYAGLTLARSLQYPQAVSIDGRPVEVIVLEARDSLDGIEVGGDLIVPQGEKVLQQMGLSSQWAAMRTSESSVPRQALQLVLARSLRPGTLQCGCSVGWIEEAEDDQLILGIRGRNGERHGSMGPYNLVVLAPGMSQSPIQTWASLWQQSAARILVVGDAQWAQGRWWDLGLARIRRGADIALWDGQELAQCLRSSLTCSS